MLLWETGDIRALVEESRAIQQRLKRCPDDDKKVAKSFSKLMKQGKVSTAMRVLEKVQGKVISIHDPADSDRSVLDVLRDKHPAGKNAAPESLVDGQDAKNFHPVIFESIDCDVIRKTALKTDGWAGPSGIDARGFRQMCISFGKASDELCWSMSCVALLQFLYNCSAFSNKCSV